MTDQPVAPSGSAVARYRMETGDRACAVLAACTNGFNFIDPVPEAQEWVRAEDFDQVVQAKDAEIARLTADLEDADRDVYESWSVLSFDWASMPEPMRVAARDSARDALYALGTRLRVALKGQSRMGVVAPVKTRHEAVEATLREQLEAADAARLQAEQRLEGLKAEHEAARLRAYRQARIFEPSMDGYNGAMATYTAAFGKPDGEPELLLPDGSTKQPWEIR